MIRIRGLNSINGGNEPLVVIDGLQGGELEDVDPFQLRAQKGVAKSFAQRPHFRQLWHT